MFEHFAFEESSEIILSPVEFAWVPRTPFLSFVELLVKKDIRDLYVLQRETQMGIMYPKTVIQSFLHMTISFTVSSQNNDAKNLFLSSIIAS
jgi:hypothetical protein